MSTAPVTPAPAPKPAQPVADLETKVVADLKWVKTHIILLIVVAALVFASVYGVESVIAKDRAANDSKWQAILAAQTQQTSALQTQLTKDEQSFAQQNAALLQTIAQLSAQRTARDTQTQKQVQVDANLSAVDTAARLAQQTNAAAQEVTVQGASILLDLPIARSVVASLDTLSSVQADLADVNGELAAETTVAQNNAADAAEQKKLIAAMTVQASDADKTCKADVAKLKADARKSKLRWFGAGFIAGLITGHFGI